MPVMTNENIVLSGNFENEQKSGICKIVSLSPGETRADAEGRRRDIYAHHMSLSDDNQPAFSAWHFEAKIIKQYVYVWGNVGILYILIVISVQMYWNNKTVSSLLWEDIKTWRQ